MARKVFFSFHYERDAWRAGQVRNSNVIAKENQVGVIDAAQWESIKKKGDPAIEKWINEQLQGTSATAVLIGAETADREWVLHEIEESWNRGNGVVGIRIHNVKDSDKKTDTKGENPLARFELSDGTRLSSICKTYDWVNDNGRDNIGDWIEEAIEIRAEFDNDAEITLIEKGANALVNAAAAVGVVALGALAARGLASPSEPRRVPSPAGQGQRPFAPRVPWSSSNDQQ